MSINLGENIKRLRKEKNVSQEKLAQYLNVSFQAVSKWENSNTYPDIMLLPEIARFFGITLDELLQVEQIDEERLFEEYCKKATEQAYCDGNYANAIPMWQEAYQKMPNNVGVKTSLMQAYYDTDKVKYQKEIIELGTEIYHSDCRTYNKGEAIAAIARTYSAVGNREKATEWAMKAYEMNHSLEMLLIDITDDGEKVQDIFGFANWKYLRNLYHMACRMASCENVPGGNGYMQSVFKAIAAIYELVYPNDDMGYEEICFLCWLHMRIAEYETSLGKDEAVIRSHLTRAAECAVKYPALKEHDLKHPLVMNVHADAAPSAEDSTLFFINNVTWRLRYDGFDEYRSTEWFVDIENKLNQFKKAE